MANHCYNSITFHGKDLSKIKEMIAEAIEVNKTEGWLPKSIDVSKLSYVHYLFDVDIVYYEGEDKIFINCWTKWSPPLDELEHICREAQVSCYCSYDECGNLLYGEAEYNLETGYTTNVQLDDDDFSRVEYDEENDQYLFDGEPIESDSEAYQTILDEKLKHN